VGTGQRRSPQNFSRVLRISLLKTVASDHGWLDTVTTDSAVCCGQLETAYQLDRYRRLADRQFF